MLSVLLPGVGAFWIAPRKPLIVKLLVSLVIFLCLDYWFKAVIKYRGDHGMAAFTQSHSSIEQHHGLDMLKELCYINEFIASGRYSPNWGGRYFAELVNFVPRAIWAGKPPIGIDYAIARGYGGSQAAHGVFATISTGLIGQGVVNFGRVLGIAAVSLLLAVWIGVLSRLWLQRSSPFRLLLFLIGLGITFNCGRDITLLVLFPFVFGYVFLLWWERYYPVQQFHLSETGMRIQ